MAKRAFIPTIVKNLNGNPGKRPLPENEPTPYPKAPKCPDDIDSGAQDVWKRLGPKLERLGLLTETDGDLFSMLCQIRSRLVWIHQEIDKGDEKRRSFLLKEERLYSALLRQYATEFGLSPRGRVGLTVAGKEVESDNL